MHTGDDKIMIVEEAIAAYLVGLPKYSLKDRMPRELSSRDIFSDKMLLVNIIRKGIPQALFMSLKEITPFSDQDWSDFLDISLKSLQRYKADTEHVFKAIHSEKIIELAEVTSVGMEVFDTRDDFAAWLAAPSLALGNMRPLELLRDSYGKEIVLNELNRIDQGIFV
ncbi:hypothetical protein GCM10009119_03670 [Algoriphagus jejuensis]|uniref:Antitoxin Xre/MbcA/ParS-like toxin-binding domain-containing protein n=1 Tax=Algoriphagus jejuensis TaxID=419934 RepID=A0ABP3Y760_9BACT